MAELDGIYDVSRYYKIVTPQIEQELAKRQAEAAKAAQAEGPADPAKALLAIEQIKGQNMIQAKMVDSSMDARKLAQKAINDQEQLDLARDKLDQDRALKMAELGVQRLNVVESNKAKEKERENETDGDTAPARAKKAGGKPA